MIIQLLFARQNLNGKLTAVNRGARHLSYGIRLTNPMQLDSALKLAEPLALSCGVNAVLAQRLEGVVSYQVELPGAYWEYYTRADLPTLQAVGLAEQRRPVAFELDPPHALVAGTTGSGKSEAVKSALLALMSSYSPQELGVIIIDPNNDYQDFENEAHLVMPVATEAGAIKTALSWVNQELARRKAENIKDGKIIVVAIDEADQALADPAGLAIASIVSKQARKYQIHLLIATQKPLHSSLPDILGNLMNRFVGQLADAQTSARVTGHAGLMAHKLTPKGDFLHITGPDVNRFQVAMATQADYNDLERMEVRPVEVQRADVIELPADLPEARPGRPALTVNPDYAAWYFYHHPDKISRSMARNLLGLSRDGHELHLHFVKDFIKAYLALRQEGSLLSG